MIKYLSYSALKLFRSDPETYYWRYISENKGPREPQNHYMAIGSSFDAFVKSKLYREVVKGNNPEYEEMTIFEAQVEPQCRDLAWKDGKTVMKAYEESGAYDRLRRELEGAVGEPRFEITLTAKIGDAIILGKPDVYYVNKNGCQITHDFKVNGFYSKNPPSPSPGYVSLLPSGGMHTKCFLSNFKGTYINGMYTMDKLQLDWAEQLSMYSWIMGCEVGSDYILSVDQICCDSRKGTQRFARHMALCSEEWQKSWYDTIQKVWKAVQQKHIFMSIPYEDNLRRIEALEKFTER